MPLDQPTYPGEAEFLLATGTVTSAACANPGLALDNDPSTSAVFGSPGIQTGTGNGVNAVYRQDGPGNPLNSFEDTVHTGIEATVDKEYYGGLPPFLNPSYGNIDADWTGWIVPGYSETYTFSLDPGVFADYANGVSYAGAGAITIGGQNVMTLTSGLDSHGPASGTIALTAGVAYSIEVNRSENPYNFYVRLLWESASQPQQVVPESALYTALPPLASRFLRVDFGQTVQVARIRLGLAGAGAGNAAVLLVLPNGATTPVAFGSAGSDGVIEDTLLSGPTAATGIVFEPDFLLNTTGLAASSYPAVSLNQLQVYAFAPNSPFGTPCVCDWDAAASCQGGAYALGASADTAFAEPELGSTVWTKLPSCLNK